MQNFDWPGLLKWSLQYTEQPSGNVQARSKEDLEFLEQAIKIAHGMIPDYHKTCLEAIALLSSSQDPNEILAALGVIQDCLDFEPELARDLANRPEAIKHLLNCFAKVEPLSLEQACLALNSMLPNNPKLQKLVFDNDGLNIFQKRLDPLLNSCLKSSDPDELRLLTRVYGCISSLVKSSLEIEIAFVRDGRGVKATLTILEQLMDPRIVTKAASLLQHLLALKTLKPEGTLLFKIDSAIAAAIQGLPREGNVQCKELVELLASTAMEVTEDLPKTKAALQAEKPLESTDN